MPEPSSIRSANKLATAIALGAFLSAGVPGASAGELKISGAAAVAGAVITPNKAAIESETGLTLTVTVNGDGNGLKDLYAGKTDVAMVAAPVKMTEEVLNKAAPGSISVADFQVAPIGAVRIRFVVNAANPARSLSEAQLKDIFTGKITSWKDVGGADEPIVVVAEAPGFGTRSNIVKSFLGGEEVTDKARAMQALVQVAQVVAQLPNAIGYGNAATIAGAATPIPGVEVMQPLGLATKGPPSADAKKLIEAAAKYGAAAK